MINSLKIWPLLDGARGRQACDKKALAKALANFSNLVYELGGLIQEFDVNPLKALANGCVAVDALVIQKKIELFRSLKQSDKRWKHRFKRFD